MLRSFWYLCRLGGNAINSVRVTLYLLSAETGHARPGTDDQRVRDEYETSTMGRTGWQNGLIAGVVASALATTVMLVLRVVADVPSIPELVVEWVTTWLPMAALDASIRRYGSLAKPLAFSVMFVALLAVGGGLGSALGGLRWGRRPMKPYVLTAESLLVASLLCGGVILVLGAFPSLPGAAAPFVVFGVALASCFQWLVDDAAVPAAALASPVAPVGLPAVGLPAVKRTPALLDRRRQQLQRIAWIGLAVTGGTSAWRFAASPRVQENMGASPGSRGSLRGEDGLPPEVTPNDSFYRVSKNLRDPRVPPAEWRLHINGLVARPVVLTYEELIALPHKAQWQTLMCISNQVGGDFMSNALWTGVPLMDLIALTGGIDTKARRLVLRAADGYSETFPAARALDATTLLATTMNGDRLPLDHGFPARLLVPGIYGLKNVKWVNTIELVEQEVRGYWQQRGWTDTAVVKTTSRIDFPRRGTSPAAAIRQIAGVAFSGDRKIAKVEVSDDAGETWQAAQLKPPTGDFTWVFWELPWAPRPGHHRLVVRATDGQGALQRAEPTSALPDGAAGYHTVDVRVT